MATLLQCHTDCLFEMLVINDTTEKPTKAYYILSVEHWQKRPAAVPFYYEQQLKLQKYLGLTDILWATACPELFQPW